MVNDYFHPSLSGTHYSITVEGCTHSPERKRVIKQTQRFTELTEQQKNDVLLWAIKKYLHNTTITITYSSHSGEEIKELRRIVFKRAKKTVEVVK